MTTFDDTMAANVASAWHNGKNLSLKELVDKAADWESFKEFLNDSNSEKLITKLGGKTMANLLKAAEGAQSTSPIDVEAVKLLFKSPAASAAPAIPAATVPVPVTTAAAAAAAPVVTSPSVVLASSTYVPQVTMVTPRLAIAAAINANVTSEGHFVAKVDISSVETQVARMFANVDKAQVQSWVASNNMKQDLWGMFLACVQAKGFPGFIGFCAATLLVSPANRLSMFGSLKMVDIAKNRTGNINKSLIYLAGNAGMAAAMDDPVFKLIVANSPNPLVATDEPAPFRAKNLAPGASVDDHNKSEIARKASYDTYVATFKDIKTRYQALFSGLDPVIRGDLKRATLDWTIGA